MIPLPFYVIFVPVLTQVNLPNDTFVLTKRDDVVLFRYHR